jgi:DNA-directed RNA polymerase subunit RPC12/RpoP
MNCLGTVPAYNKPPDECRWVWTDWDNIDCGYETECGKESGYSEYNQNSFVYCPYCGKKIKVVE